MGFACRLSVRTVGGSPSVYALRPVLKGVISVPYQLHVPSKRITDSQSRVVAPNTLGNELFHKGTRLLFASLKHKATP